MPIHNADIQRLFQELADLLEIEGANPFRTRAYRNAARTVTGLSESITDKVKKQEDLTELQGIGKELAEKMKEIVQTGSLKDMEEARKRVSPELASLLKMSGLGPKKVKALHEQLGITSIQDLQQAAQSGTISTLPGFGSKTQTSILEELERFSSQELRYTLDAVEAVVQSLESFLESLSKVNQVTTAGSYRRRKETVGDIDILVTADDPDTVMNAFVQHEEVAEVLVQGSTKTSIKHRMGIQVDLRVVPEASYGAALHYFTGSKAHNIAVRKLALERSYKINEYGVFKGKKPLAGRTEEAVYSQLDLPWIPPELREDRGEIQAAQHGSLPELITEHDLQGDLHCHTNWSDGRQPLEEMARAAQDMGYEYLAVTDHTHNLKVVNGLGPERLAQQIEAIEEINKRMEDFTLLKGAEVDILEDGRLDLPDAILQRLDLCVCSVHTRFKLSRQQQTERILKAMDNPYCTVLGHPSGRLLGSREPYDLDMDQILNKAEVTGCCIEINSQPDRLDLTDTHCKAAKDMGITLAISSDAHRPFGLQAVRFGIGQARRGWLEPRDVLNTRPLQDLWKRLKRT